MAVQSIVIAIDGSPEAWFAAELGLQLARASNATVTFLRASTDEHRRLGAIDPSLPTRQDDLAASDPVLGKALEHAQMAGVDARIELVPADTPREISSEITSLATEVNADLIVVGSRGRGAVVSSVLGHVSRAVLRDATIPTVVVKVPNARTAA